MDDTKIQTPCKNKGLWLTLALLTGILTIAYRKELTNIVEATIHRLTKGRTGDP